LSWPTIAALFLEYITIVTAGVKVNNQQAVEKVLFCHPELVSGSHNQLFLLDAESSSA